MNPEMSRRHFLRLLSAVSVAPLLNRPVVASRRAVNLRESGQAPNVIILVFDALSATNMALHGYPRETTPNLARFAERATVYHRHYAGGNYTSPGTASLLTGTYPWTHRAFNLWGSVAQEKTTHNLFHLFATAGYHTLAYTHNPVAHVLLNQLRGSLDRLKPTGDLFLLGSYVTERLFPKDFGVAIENERIIRHASRSKEQGSIFLSFYDQLRKAIIDPLVLGQEYETQFPRGVPRYFGPYYVLEDAIDWLQTEASNWPQPFLSYVHVLPPHAPYSPRREFTHLFEDGWQPVAKEPHFFSKGSSNEEQIEKRLQYDQNLAYCDAEFGRLYETLAQKGLLDNTYFVVTSDHGEMFERGIIAHTTETLYEPVIRVPLLISGPGQQQRQDVYTPTSCIDLLPTLAQATDQAIPAWAEGQVLPTFGDAGRNGDRGVLVMEAKRNPKQAPLTEATVALIRDPYKLIYYSGYDGHQNVYELYDLRNDPEELEDLYSSKTAVVAELQAELTGALDRANQAYRSS